MFKRVFNWRDSARIVSRWLVWFWFETDSIRQAWARSERNSNKFSSTEFVEVSGKTEIDRESTAFFLMTWLKTDLFLRMMYLKVSVITKVTNVSSVQVDDRRLKAEFWLFFEETWLKVASKYLQRFDLNTMRSYNIFKMISCLFIHDLPMMMRWLFNDTINIRQICSAYSLTLKVK